MCGIVGSLYFKNNSSKVEEKILLDMRNIMQHRGPDGASLWVHSNKKVGFGHLRLSIIDLSDTATQPMTSPDGRYTLTFNGEIYNHAEIRQELINLGHNDWRTSHSDTEVVLFSFRQWGIDCIKKFRGMFAFAIWDDVEQKLWLVRDRIGIKPLYYTINDTGLHFASEIKGLLMHPDQKREMDETALFYYLSVMTTPAPFTLFKNIKKLTSAHWLCIDSRGAVKTHKYWDVWDNINPLNNVSEEEIAEQILTELSTAVNYRKVGDVPMGVFLSGGIDSSTNAALFAKGEHDPIKTFSIGYSQEYGSYKNELHFAQQMADKIEAEHHIKKLTIDDLLSFIPQMIHLQDEPIADPVCVPVYYVSKLARDNGVTVSQVGEGADELFWGYPLWKLILQARKLSEFPSPLFIKKVALQGLNMRGRGEWYFSEMLRRSINKEPFFYSGAETFSDYRKKMLLSHRMNNQFEGCGIFDALSDIKERFDNNAHEKSPLNWMSYMDLNLRLPELLLMRVDKMSMGVSLECRVPFLDHKFVELAMSIPSSIKMRNGTLKHILKKAVRGVIPDELIDRKKQGFGVPIHEWFSDKLGHVMETEIMEFCQQTDVFNNDYVTQLFQNKDAVSLWWLYNLAAWHKHFIATDNFKSL